MKVPTLKTAVGAGFVILLLNTGYISAFATPSIFYMANVLLHLVLGLVLAVAFALLLKREPDLRRPADRAGGVLCDRAGLCAVAGLGGQPARAPVDAQRAHRVVARRRCRAAAVPVPAWPDRGASAHARASASGTRRSLPPRFPS